MRASHVALANRLNAMSASEIRSLSSLENSASTARVLNLRKVFVDHGDDEDYKKAPFFNNVTLNRCLILKHRLRRNEQDEFTEFRNVATKPVVHID